MYQSKAEPDFCRNFATSGALRGTGAHLPILHGFHRIDLRDAFAFEPL